MHGLPKFSKEEMAKQAKMYTKKVDFKEFLPNSLANNAKKKMHSHTYLTQKLNLYDVKGGFGNNSEIFDRQRHSEMITKVGPQFVESGGNGDYKISEKKEGFGLQCHGPLGTVRTPKSALAEDKPSQMLTPYKP